LSPGPGLAKLSPPTIGKLKIFWKARRAFTANKIGGGMSKWLVWALAAATAALSGCDVQVHDETPASFPADPGAAMYPIKLTLSQDMMVQSGSIYVFALNGKDRLDLQGNADQSEFHALFPVRFRSSFPLQYQVRWRLQGSSQRQLVTPAREVTLTPPAQPADATIDTSAKATAKGWEGGVAYKFVTAEHSQITAAHIDPVSQDPQDVEAAKPIVVDSSFPIDAPCNAPSEVHLASKSAKAHGNLVIDTDVPGQAHWTTKVTFEPKSGSAGDASAVAQPAGKKKKGGK